MSLTICGLTLKHKDDASMYTKKLRLSMVLGIENQMFQKTFLKALNVNFLWCFSSTRGRMIIW